ncbi:unnamed protein product [Colias eurytheme]|nr:unnamed protein product [Colias eurytheme]
MKYCSNNYHSSQKQKSKNRLKEPPTRLTESISLKLGVETWGLISGFYLESVKVNCYKPDEPTTTAIFKILSDMEGQIVCVLKGKTVGLLFDVTADEWADIENMCQYGQQLFYRDFKEGLSKNYKCEQKIFFNFCKTNQTKDILVAICKRGVNNRNKDKDDILLNVTELMKCNSDIIDKYTYYLRNISLLS